MHRRPSQELQVRTALIRRVASSAVGAAALILLVSTAAGAQEVDSEWRDPSDGALSSGAADLLSVSWSIGAKGGSTVRLLMEDPGTVSEPRTVLVWADADKDNVADALVRFDLSKPGEAYAEASTGLSGTAGCQPTFGPEPLASGAATSEPSGGNVAVSFSFPYTPPARALRWAALARTDRDPPLFDYVPDQSDPARDSTDAGTRDCELPGDEKGQPTGQQVLLGSGVGTAPTFTPEFFDLFDESAGLGALAVNPFVPRIDASAPTVTLRPLARAPRAGSKLVLDASRSSDPSGMQGFAWDLDDDGEFDDAFGSKVTLSVPNPGARAVTVEGLDSSGRRASAGAKLRVAPSGRAPLTKEKIAAAVAKARPGRGSTQSFDRSLKGWTRLGPAFPAKPVRGKSIPVDRELNLSGTVGGSYGQTKIPVGSKGRGWISSFNPKAGSKTLAPNARGDAAVGVIASPRFVVKRPYLGLRVGGSDRREPGLRSTQFVQLWAARGENARLRPVRRLTVRAGSQEAMRNVTLDVRALTGRPAVLVLSDRSPFGHINVDQLVALRKAPRPQPPPPVHGFADTHAHPLAHQGFGGLNGIRTYMGVPGGSVDEYRDPLRGGLSFILDTLRDSDTHFGGLTSRIFVNALEGTTRPDIHSAIASVDGRLGHPDTRGPAHEQMHITEIHRAWQGGLRLLSSLAINNPGAEFGMGHTQVVFHYIFAYPPFLKFASARESIEAHVAGMRQLERLNSRWMKIVYSPEQAREAIEQDKLAIVLGSELPTLGTINPTDPAAEVDYLWRLGIRQVILVHAANNKIGGAATFQDGYNSVNDLLNRNAKPFGPLGTVDERMWEPGQRGPYQVFNVTDSIVNDWGDFGAFIDVENASCHTGAIPRGDCLDWQFAKHKQGILSVNRLHRGVSWPYEHRHQPYLAQRGGQRNARGLTEYGRGYVRALMNRGMVIDLEHMSDRMVADLIAPKTGARPAGVLWEPSHNRDGCPLTDQSEACQDAYASAYPLLSGHTSFRALKLQYGPGRAGHWLKAWGPREFDRAMSHVEYIRRTRGLVAPFALQNDPTANLETTTVANAAPLDWRIVQGRDAPLRYRVANDCAGSTKSWAQQYLYAVSKMRGAPVALATDWLFIGGPSPRFSDPARDEARQGPNACRASYGAETADPGCPETNLDCELEVPPTGVRRVQAERLGAPGQFNRAAQGNPVVYGAPDQRNLSTAAGTLRPLVRPSGSVADVNRQGGATYGMLPDLIQDLRNVGMLELGPLMSSAQGYIDMWSQAYGAARCFGDPEEEARCVGGPPAVLDETAVCRNTCPDDPGHGFDLDPAGRRFPFTRVGTAACGSRC